VFSPVHAIPNLVTDRPAIRSLAIVVDEVRVERQMQLSMVAFAGAVFIVGVGLGSD